MSCFTLWTFIWLMDTVHSCTAVLAARRRAIVSHKTRNHSSSYVIKDKPDFTRGLVLPTTKRWIFCSPATILIEASYLKPRWWCPVPDIFNVVWLKASKEKRRLNSRPENFNHYISYTDIKTSHWAVVNHGWKLRQSWQLEPRTVQFRENMSEMLLRATIFMINHQTTAMLRIFQ